MKKKRLLSLISILALLLAALLVYAPGDCQAKEWVLKLAASREGTATYSSAVGISACINKNLSKKGIRMVATPTPGSTGSVKMLPKGGVDLAFTSTWVLRDSYNNTGPFKKKPVSVKALQGWYFGTVIWLPSTKKGNKIKTLHDLVGKKFYPYEGGSGVYAVYRYILTKMKLWDKINIRRLSGMEAADALKMGTIDAVGTYASSGGYAAGGWIRNLDAAAELKLLELSKAEKDMISNMPGLTVVPKAPKAWLTPKNQKNNPQTLWGWSLHYGMFPGPHIPTEVMYQVYKTWIEKADTDLAGVSKIMDVYAHKEGPMNLQLHGIEEAKDIPVHPGVAKYLKERKVWKKHWKIGKLNPGVK